MEENENPQSRELVRKTGILFETLGACRKQVSFTITVNVIMTQSILVGLWKKILIMNVLEIANYVLQIFCNIT